RFSAAFPTAWPLIRPCSARAGIQFSIFPHHDHPMTQSASEFISDFVDRHFGDACRFLAEIVKVPSDNPPGDCAPSARRTLELLRSLGLEVEVHDVPEAGVRVNGMISATNLIVRQRFGDGGPVVALNAHGDVVPPGQGWTHDPYGADIVD